MSSFIPTQSEKDDVKHIEKKCIGNSIFKATEEFPYKISYFDRKSFLNLDKPKLLKCYKVYSDRRGMYVNEEARPEQLVKLVIDCDKPNKHDKSYTVASCMDMIKPILKKTFEEVFEGVEYHEPEPIENTKSRNVRLYFRDIILRNKHRRHFHTVLMRNADEELRKRVTFDGTDKLRTVYSYKVEKDETSHELVPSQGIYQPAGSKLDNLYKYSLFNLDEKDETRLKDDFVKESDSIAAKRLESKKEREKGLDMRRIKAPISERCRKIFLENLDPDMSYCEWMTAVNALYNVGCSNSEIHQWSEKSEKYDANAKDIIDRIETKRELYAHSDWLFRKTKDSIKESSEILLLIKLLKIKVDKEPKLEVLERYTDKDLADMFYEDYQDVIIVPNRDAKECYIYNDTKKIWISKGKSEMLIFISEALVPKLTLMLKDKEGDKDTTKSLNGSIKDVKSYNKLKGITELAFPMFINDEFNVLVNSKKFIFPFSDGTLFDFEKGYIREITKEDYVLSTCHIKYEKNEEDIKFAREYFSTVYNNDEEKIEFILRFLGWSLMKDKNGFEFMVLVGSEGSNSKDTLLNMMKEILGEDYKVGNDAIFMKRNGGQANSHTSHLIPITNKKLVYVGEPEGGFNVEAVKRITGCSHISIRPIGKEEKQVEVTSKFILSVNQIPQPDKKDAGFEKRIIVIETPITFNEMYRGQDNFREPDPDIAYKIKKHIGGFLWLLIEGGMRYMKQQMKNPPKSVVSGKDSYIEEYDMVKRFVSRLKPIDNKEYRYSDDSFLEMYNTKFPNHRLDKKAFKARLTAFGIVKEKQTGNMVYKYKYMDSDIVKKSKDSKDEKQSETEE